MVTFVVLVFVDVAVVLVDVAVVFVVVGFVFVFNTLVVKQTLTYRILWHTSNLHNHISNRLHFEILGIFSPCEVVFVSHFKKLTNRTMTVIFFIIRHRQIICCFILNIFYIYNLYILVN